jgi:hypothetical protein
MARQEKQRAKAARRLQRKLEKQEPGENPQGDVPVDRDSPEAAEPFNPNEFKENV